MFTFVAKQEDTGNVENDMAMVPLQGQPAWALDGSTCNTWLFVNDGAQAIDYARGTNEHWTSDGFDFQKNIWVWNKAGTNINLMNKSQRDFLGRQNDFGQMNVISSAGLNPGRCQDGNNNMPGGCVNMVEVSSADPFVGMWDIESATDLYTADNRMRYDYSLYCRWQEPPSIELSSGICQRNDDFTAADNPSVSDWNLHSGLGMRSCDESVRSEENCRAMCARMDGCNMFAFNTDHSCCFPFRSTTLDECNPDMQYNTYRIHLMN